jgi:SAM-dependent methyltransferase
MKSFLNNGFYFTIGIAFLALAKIKHAVYGYTSPKPFSTSEFQRCADYDIQVVDQWIAHLQEYTKDNASDILSGKRILELGPGSDLGVGLYLLSKSISQYNAVDVNNLVQTVPKGFYVSFLAHLKQSNADCDVAFLKAELEKTSAGNNDKLNYVCRKDFDISAAGLQKIDIVFSQAAFEHFDDVDQTIASISAVTAPGSIMVVLIDLQTHSRWIRHKDPINIYRYARWLYRLFAFRGIPNRVRPYQYMAACERHGWSNIVIKAGVRLAEDRYRAVKNSLDKQFIDDRNQMDLLSAWLYATKV